jgi:hypothetical protein
VLNEAASNDFGPAWRQVILEMGLDGLLGNNLKDRIDDIFQRNQITPSEAHKEIQTILNDLTQLKQALDQLLHGFQHFRIAAEDLQPGQCELSILVPRSFVKNRFGRLGREFRELDKTFRVFSELVTGTRPAFEIRTISTTDPVVVLLVVTPVGACIAKTISWLLESYERILNIRLMHRELSVLDMPDDIIRRVDEEADTRIDRDIDGMVDRLLDEYESSDEGRRNELRTELRQSLKKIVARIDRGFNIEIRVKPEELPPPPEDEAEDEETIRKREEYDVIQSTAKRLQYRKLEGEPILRLPELQENDDE